MDSSIPVEDVIELPLSPSILLIKSCVFKNIMLCKIMTHLNCGVSSNCVLLPSFTIAYLHHYFSTKLKKEKERFLITSFQVPYIRNTSVFAKTIILSENVGHDDCIAPSAWHICLKVLTFPEEPKLFISR